MAALDATGDKGVLEIVAATHSGMTTDAFAKIVTDWIATARHPRFRRPYNELIFQPMVELLNYLRANGFKTFIVSGGGIEFMRTWVEQAYGIPPEQVVGSSGVTKLQTGAHGKPELMKESTIEFVDDGPGKPVGINRFIGRRPIFAVGNSDGDLQMLQWTAAGGGARFTGLVHHTDVDREYAYDRKSNSGRLDKALDEANAKGRIFGRLALSPCQVGGQPFAVHKSHASINLSGGIGHMCDPRHSPTLGSRALFWIRIGQREDLDRSNERDRKAGAESGLAVVDFSRRRCRRVDDRRGRGPFRGGDRRRRADRDPRSRRRASLGRAVSLS